MMVALRGVATLLPFSRCDKTLAKTNVGRKSLHLTHHDPSLGEAGTPTGSVEGGCSLAFSLASSQAP